MKRFVRVLFIIISFFGVITYLLASCTPYISPSSFWPMTFLALGFPIIAISFLVICIIWFFMNRKVAIVFLLLFFIAGYPNLHSTFAINIPAKFNYKKEKNTLRILTWNVRYFDNNTKAADTAGSVRRQMFDYIVKANADVMMFQDYLDYYSDDNSSNIGVIRDSLGYKYCYTVKDIIDTRPGLKTEHGVAIYSKFPILDSGKTLLFPPYYESVGHADIKVNNKIVRFLTAHLLSMSIHPGAQLKLGNEKYEDALRYSESVSRTLKLFDQVHVSQALVIKKEKEKSPYPVIVTGDFNSVPSSYVYHTVKGNLQDAFVQKGWKLGHTYVGLSRTLRIDYLLVDPKFKVLQVETPKLYLSDHFPVVADIQLEK